MSCFQNISADDYVTELLNKPSPDSYPLVCTWDITERCNFNCIHCFLGGQRTKGLGDISLEEGIQILDTLAAHGVLVLVMTGGEPLLHPDFMELWLAAKKRGFLITLFTNASAIDAELALFLAENPPRRVEVSVYGCTEKIYESITGVKGSFSAFCEGIDHLQGVGLNMHLKFPVMRENQHELDRAKEWSSKLGIKLRFDAMISPTLDGNKEPLKHRISCETATEIDAGNLARSKKKTDVKYDYRRFNDKLVQCGAGVRSIHVDVAGRIHPCVLWRDENHFLLKTPPVKWNAMMSDLRKGILPALSLCKDCNMRLLCPSCPALSKLETGTAGENLKYYCDLITIYDTWI